jgi:hypothetical protein
MENPAIEGDGLPAEGQNKAKPEAGESFGQ